MNFLTTTLPLRAYLFTFTVFVTVIIYVQNGFSVGSYSIRLSFLMKQMVIAIKKENILTYLTFFANRPEYQPLPLSETRDYVTKNFETHPWYLQKVALKGFCTENIGEKMANTENETVAKKSWRCLFANPDRYSCIYRSSLANNYYYSSS